MKTIRLLPALLVTGFILASVGRATPVDAEEKIKRAQAQFAETMEKARGLLLDALKSTKADESSGPRVRLDLEAFEQRGVLPASLPKAGLDFEKARQGATERLLRTLNGIEQSCRAEAHYRQADVAAEAAIEVGAQCPEALWIDLRLRVEDFDESGPSWSGPSLHFDGAVRRTLHVKAPRLKPGEGYVLRLELERLSGKEGIQLLFPRADHEDRELGLLILGGFGGDTSGFELIDGKSVNENPSRTARPIFSSGAPTSIELKATPEGHFLSINGTEAISWKDSGRLGLSEAVAKSFKQNKKAFSLVVPKGTSARLDAAFALETPAIEPASAAVVAASSRREPVAPDPFKIGTHWKGTWFDGNGCTAEVVARDRNGQTASFRVFGERKAMFRFDLKTRKDSGKFTIEDIRQTGARPGEPLNGVIEFKNGSGSLSTSGLRMRWRANKKEPAAVRSWSSSMTAKG